MQTHQVGLSIGSLIGVGAVTFDAKHTGEPPLGCDLIWATFLAEPTMLTLGSRMIIEFYGSNVATEVHGGVGFFDDGTVASGYLNQDTVLVLSDGSVAIEIPRLSQVYFDRAGLVTHVNYPE